VEVLVEAVEAASSAASGPEVEAIVQGCGEQRRRRRWQRWWLPEGRWPKRRLEIENLVHLKQQIFDYL